MEKFIPYEKLSKKQQRLRNKQKRTTWQGVNPVTRKPPNPKQYNRAKNRQWKKDAFPPIAGSFMKFNNLIIPHLHPCGCEAIPA